MRRPLAEPGLVFVPLFAASAFCVASTLIEKGLWIAFLFLLLAILAFVLET